MPQWTTHTEGGSWHGGGGTQVEDCNLTQRTAIVDAFNGFINASCLECFPGLRQKLIDKFHSVEIDCTDSACDGSLAGRWNGSKLLLCDTSPNRVGSLLLHELVHAVGGKELDSEAIEWACFQSNGATAPFGDDTDSDSDWHKFKSETSEFNGNSKERVGEFVIWNMDTGEVWGKTQEGGGWGGGKVVKGSRCFQATEFQHTYSSGGGWG